MSESEKGEVVESQEAYQYFERWDEDAIRAEMQGIYVETLVYQFEGRDSRMVTGLSIKGVYELAKSMVRRGYDIVCEEAKIIDESPEEYKSSCKATFTAPNGKTLTTFGYSKAMKNYGRNINEFAYVQALSKAQRNALRTLIPEKQATEFIKAYLEEKRGGRVQVIKPARAEVVGVKTTEPVKAVRESVVDKALEKSKSEVIQVPMQVVEVVERSMLRFLGPVPQFVGIDMKSYGPYKAEDVGNIPLENVKSLVRDGLAQEVFGEGRKKAEEQLKENRIIGGEAGGLGEKAVEKEREVAKMWPLQAGEKSYGKIDEFVGGCYVQFDFPIDVEANVGPVRNFLESRFLTNLGVALGKEGKSFSYELNESEAGLEGIYVTGELSEARIRDLAKTCAWVCKVASEKKMG